MARLPTDLRAQLRARWYQARVAARLRQRELAQVLRALHSEAIDPVLLKGAALLVAEVYPAPELRLMGDIDLWLQPRDVPRALEILAARGYRLAPHPRRPTALRMRYQQEVELVGNSACGEAVDVHYHPFIGWWAILAARVPPHELWTRRHVVTWNGLRVSLLAPEDHLLHLAFHFAIVHHLGAPGIQAVLDMALSLRARPVDWEHICQRARAWRLQTVMWSTLTCVRMLWPDRVPLEVLTRLAPPRWQRTLLSSMLPDARALLCPRPNGGRARYLLNLLHCDSPAIWPRLFAWALWPEREWLYLRYGSASPLMRVRHMWNVLAHPLF